MTRELAGAGVRAEIKEDDTVHMTLMGEVGWEIDAASVASELRKAKGKKIRCEIFSYGGDAMAGLAIYQMLASHDAEVETSVMGLAASAASVIAMAGKKRSIPSNGALMIHPAWGFSIGNANQMRKDADVLEGITSAYLRTYAAASGRPAAEIEPYLNDESWLYGEDAVALGLATDVADPIMAMASVPGLTGDRYSRIPEQIRSSLSLTKPTEEKVNTLQNVNHAECEPPAAPQPMAVDPTPNEDAVLAARLSERERVASIRGLCKAHKMPESLTDELIGNGVSVADARAEVLERLGAKSGEIVRGGIADAGASNIGLSQREVHQYSFVKLATYLADPNPRTAEAAGFELECSRAAMAGHSRSPNGQLIPWDVLTHKPQASQIVGTFGDGGALVGSQRLDGSFIDLVRNRSAILNSGVTILSGLQGNVEIPKKLTSSTYYMVGENVDVTNSKLTFGVVNMTPKTMGVRVPISRRMMIQASPDIEGLVRSDMAESVAIGMDSLAFYGSGSSSQPLGIRSTSGIGSVTLGGGASKTFPTDLGSGTHDCGDWADYVDLESAVAASNLDVPNMRYVFNSVVRGGLKQTLRASAAGSDFIYASDNTINGYATTVSNQMQTNDVLFGNFADAVVGMWSGLDVTVDPYTQSASGQVILTVHQDFDVAVRRIQSFALGT